MHPSVVRSLRHTNSHRALRTRLNFLANLGRTCTQGLPRPRVCVTGCWVGLRARVGTMSSHTHFPRAVDRSDPAFNSEDPQQFVESRAQRVRETKIAIEEVRTFFSCASAGARAGALGLPPHNSIVGTWRVCGVASVTAHARGFFASPAPPRCACCKRSCSGATTATPPTTTLSARTSPRHTRSVWIGATRICRPWTTPTASAACAGCPMVASR